MKSKWGLLRGAKRVRVLIWWSATETGRKKTKQALGPRRTGVPVATCRVRSAVDSQYSRSSAQPQDSYGSVCGNCEFVAAMAMFVSSARNGSQAEGDHPRYWLGSAARRRSIAGCLFTPVTSRGLQPGLSEGWVDRLTNPSSCTPQRLLMLPHAVRTGHCEMEAWLTCPSSVTRQRLSDQKRIHF